MRGDGRLGEVRNKRVALLEHANADGENVNDATYNFRMQAQQYACTKLKEAVRAAYAKRTADSGPRGPIILAAVEALPDARLAGDWTKFEQLTEEERKPLRAFLTQMEINYTVDDIDRLLDEQFPSGVR